MIVLAGLLLLAAACILFAPRLLVLRGFAFRRPRLMLVLWLGVFLTGAAAVLSSVLWTAMLVVAFRTTDLDLGWIAGATAWLALGVLGVCAALVLGRAEPFLARRGTANRRLDVLAATAAYRVEWAGAVQVLHVRSDAAVAFSSSADGGRVVVTDALEHMLAPAQVQAVIAHERAHLTGRHDLLLRVAGVNRACLPSLFGACAFDRAVHLLVELVADDVAARTCGRAVLADALQASEGGQANEWAAVRAERLRLPLHAHGASRAGAPATD